MNIKILLNICGTLFLVYFSGSRAFPDIFDHWYIQLPILCVLGIFVPFGFALSYIRHKRNSENQNIDITIGYVVIFVFMLFEPLFINNSILFANSAISSMNSDAASNTKLLEVPSTAPTEERREFAARLIFNEYGKRVPYLLDSGEYMIYLPSDSDIEKHELYAETKSRAANSENEFMKTSVRALYIFASLFVAFVVITVIVIGVDKLKANKTN